MFGHTLYDFEGHNLHVELFHLSVVTLIGDTKLQPLFCFVKKSVLVIQVFNVFTYNISNIL